MPKCDIYGKKYVYQSHGTYVCQFLSPSPKKRAFPRHLACLQSSTLHPGCSSSSSLNASGGLPDQRAGKATGLKKSLDSINLTRLALRLFKVPCSVSRTELLRSWCNETCRSRHTGGDSTPSAGEFDVIMD